MNLPYSHVVASSYHVLEGVFVARARDDLVGHRLVPLPPRPLCVALMHDRAFRRRRDLPEEEGVVITETWK